MGTGRMRREVSVFSLFSVFCWGGGAAGSISVRHAACVGIGAGEYQGEKKRSCGSRLIAFPLSEKDEACGREV